MMSMKHYHSLFSMFHPSFKTIIPHKSRRQKEAPNVKGRDRAVPAGPLLPLGHNRSETTRTVEVGVVLTAGR